MTKTSDINIRPDYDPLIKKIADYVHDKKIVSNEAYETAKYILMDSLGDAVLALKYPECKKLLGPIVPGETIKKGARVPATKYELDPVQAAFNFGTMVRWLDFNDAWLAAEWGHPSDNLGGILTVADYISRQNIAKKKKPLLMKDVLTASIKAHEIQGVIALKNAFNRVGLDHVVLVKLATAAVTMGLLGGNKKQLCDVVSQVFLDGQSLRTYRHAPNTGSRKSWAAGDATSRGVWLTLITLRGEQGYPSVLSVKKWGFQDVYFSGKPIILERDFDSYVMENVLFKISFPAEFHAQTAVEAAVDLHPMIAKRLNEIKKIVIRTQESAVRIISKTGPLYNPADRDHCIQYMVAIGLIFGELTADHYEDKVAKDPRIDDLREKMEVVEDKSFSENYLHPEKRSIGNAIKIYFNDGTELEEKIVEYPIGHRRRRKEGIPLLEEKFHNNVRTLFPATKVKKLFNLFSDQKKLEQMPVNKFVDEWVLR